MIGVPWEEGNAQCSSRECVSKCLAFSSVISRDMNYTCLRFSHNGSAFSHLNNNLLHLHMMNTTMNSQQRKTVQTDMNSMTLSHQLDNLIFRSNFEPKVTRHCQPRLIPSTRGYDSPLSVQDCQTGYQ